MQRGDVVAVKLPNRIEMVTTVLAAWKLGAAITPANPSLKNPVGKIDKPALRRRFTTNPTSV